tara:strand:+ start:39409 stop:40656 length:1248 start_codon:yes stop_codon:yes gene_type:complete
VDIRLAPEFKSKKNAKTAADLIKSCVHCGFCNSTCPTFNLLGDERDSPRGRITLIKEILEGGTPTTETKLHLDRCLQCRNCETTCPSGVKYGKLYKIGKSIVDSQVKGTIQHQIFKYFLKEFLLSKLFSIAVSFGKKLHFFIPSHLKALIPLRTSAVNDTNIVSEQGLNINKQTVLLFQGCVQKSLIPSINEATSKILTFCGFDVITVKKSECCGAIRGHLSDSKGQIKNIKRNIDLWWPLIEQKKLAFIVSDASACSFEIKNFQEVLRNDHKYSKKAKALSAITKDISEILPSCVEKLKGRLVFKNGTKLAFHPPCTLQHGLKITGVIEKNLEQLGYKVFKTKEDSHICCGSAGTYSLFHHDISTSLRDKKMEQLNDLNCDTVISSNIGCITHLQGKSASAVKHWVEVLAEDLT